MTTRRPSPEQLLTENSELRRQVERLFVELTLARSHAPRADASEPDLARIQPDVLRLMPGVLYVFDLVDYKPLYVSPQANPLLGVASDANFPRGADDVSALLHPEDLPAVLAYAARLYHLVDGEFADGEWRFRHCDGGWQWLLCRNAIYERNADGTVRSVVGVIIDVTARKQSEAELAVSEARFRLASQASHDAIADVNLRADTVWWNPTYREMFGAGDPPGPPTAAENRDWLLARLHPHDRARIEQSFRGALARGESEWSDDYRIRRSDGTWADVRDRAYLEYDESGQLVRVVSSLLDRTSQRAAECALAESEARLRLALRAGQGGAWDADLVTGSSWWSPELREAWGFTGGDGSVGVAEIAARLHPDDIHVMSAATESAVRSDSPYECQYRIQHPTRGERWFASRGHVVRDAAGNAVRMHGITTDITEHKRAEGDLIEEARRKDRFLAVLAHELRNPLAPLLNGLRLLHSARADGAIAHSALEMMDRQLAQLVRLVDDLLDVSRISRDKIELRLQRVDLRDIVSAAVETSRPQIDALQHQLQVEVPPEPVLLDADLARLAQVFANLLNNAAKYTPRGGRIWLGAALDGPSVVVRVRDDGIGISPENLARVFDVFVQERHGSGGLGIGLTIVKRLVELHGGEVEARSAGTGRGSEFVVRLPLPLPEPRGANEPRAPTPPVVRVGTNVVLIVDDNRDAADSFALLVEDAGYVVHTAYTGEDALLAVEQVDPDVILLDIGLPGLDGYAVCERIRAGDALRGGAPAPWRPQSSGHERLLVAVTGWGQDEDRRRAVAAGFDEHLVKPVDPDQVLRIVHEWFAARADRR